MNSNVTVNQEQHIWRKSVNSLTNKELYFTSYIIPLLELDAINNKDEYEYQLHKIIDTCHELNRCNYDDLHQASFNVVYDLGVVWGDEVTRLIIKQIILKRLSYRDVDDLLKKIDHHYLSGMVCSLYLGMILNVVRYRAHLNLLDTEIKLYKMPYIIYKEDEPYIIVDTPDKIRERLTELGIEIKDEGR